MQAKILLLGDRHLYKEYFDASLQFLRDELARLNVETDYDIIMGGTKRNYMKVCAESLYGRDMAVILVPPVLSEYLVMVDAISEGLGIKKEKSETAAEGIAEYYSHSAEKASFYVMTAFSTVPKGAWVLPNSEGIVQGFIVSSQKQSIMLLPAIPSELSMVFNDSIKDYIKKSAEENCNKNEDTVHNIIEEDEFTLKAAEVGDVSVSELVKSCELPDAVKLFCRYSSGEYLIDVIREREEISTEDFLGYKLMVADSLGETMFSTFNNCYGEVLEEQLSRMSLNFCTIEMGTEGTVSKKLLEDCGDRFLKKSSCFKEDNATESMEDFLNSRKHSKNLTGELLNIALEAKRQARTALAILIYIENNREKGMVNGATVIVTNGERFIEKRIEERGTLLNISNTAAVTAFNIMRVYGENTLKGLSESEDCTEAINGNKFSIFK